MSIIDPTGFTKLYSTTIPYGSSGSKVNTALNDFDPDVIANRMNKGWNASGMCFYDSENQIGAYAGYEFSARNVSNVRFYIGRFSGQNKTLYVHAQALINGTWTNMTELAIPTNLPYPTNYFDVSINTTVSGIRWIHDMEPQKSSGNNVTFAGMVMYEPDLANYQVAYNANGGTGTMATQTIIMDEPTALTLNTFTRDEYIFTGWATTPAGPVVYTDGEVVTNLAAADQTVTLYAVWRPAPMTMLLQSNTSEPIKVDKDVETIASVYATLREECSIIDPVFNVQMDIADAVRCNYVTVPKFGRSYFVQEVVSVRTGLVQLSCHVDVLSSFKSQIRANSAIVHKQEGEWNLYLNDGSLRIYQDPIVITRPFPSGFSRYEYVMAIAGN